MRRYLYAIMPLILCSALAACSKKNAADPPAPVAGSEEPPATQATTAQTAPAEIPAETSPAETELRISAQVMLALNEDSVGWMKIPDTNMSFPILQVSDRGLEGNSVYLEKDLYTRYARYGSIFMDYRADFGADEKAQSDNVVLYGHNTVNGTMFTYLHSYKLGALQGRLDYYYDHPIIEVRSNYRTYQYKIFAFMITNALEKDGEVFRYHVVNRFEDEADFQQYYGNIMKRSLILTDIDVEYGDKLLMLSTCSVEFDDSRLVVVARRVREGEDPMEGVSSAAVNPNPLFPDRWYAVKGGRYNG